MKTRIGSWRNRLNNTSCLWQENNLLFYNFPSCKLDWFINRRATNGCLNDLLTGKYHVTFYRTVNAMKPCRFRETIVKYARENFEQNFQRFVINVRRKASVHYFQFNKIKYQIKPQINDAWIWNQYLVWHIWLRNRISHFICKTL